MTTTANELKRGDRVEVIAGPWAELRGHITLVERTEEDGRIVPTGWAFVSLDGERVDMKFRVDALKAL